MKYNDDNLLHAALFFSLWMFLGCFASIAGFGLAGILVYYVVRLLP